MRLSQYERASASLMLALSVADGTGDRLLKARALLDRAAVSIWTGRSASAEGDLVASFEEFRELGDVRGQAQALGNLGILLHQREKYDEAAPRLQEALAAFRQIEDDHEVATVLNS